MPGEVEVHDRWIPPESAGKLRWSIRFRFWRGLRDETPLVSTRLEKAAIHAIPELDFDGWNKADWDGVFSPITTLMMFLWTGRDRNPRVASRSTLACKALVIPLGAPRLSNVDNRGGPGLPRLHGFAAVRREESDRHDGQRDGRRDDVGPH
jgi:hypothetical protein